MGANASLRNVYGDVAAWLEQHIARHVPTCRLLPLICISPTAVTDAPTDFYHQKTDDELRFFVEHPEYYQPSLIESARRELQRRGALLAPPAPLITPNLDATPETAGGRKTGLLALLAAAVLVVGGGVIYYTSYRPSPAAVAVPVLPKSVPQLTEVATSTIPNYDGVVAQSVTQQLQRVPRAEQVAAQKANMPLHQYRELAKRFWTAETQSEYVLEQAHQNKLTEALPGHVESAEAAWAQWNKATAYSYKFGPVMANHLDLMTRVANQQQEGLADLLLVARNPQAYENEKTRKRAADISDLLSGLLPKSPVTGRPYNTLVRHINL